MQLPEIELTIEQLEGAGIQATAFVHDPAIQQGWVAFNSQEKKKEIIHFSSDEQRIVSGPLLVPEQRIYRRAEDGTEFNVFFTAEQIRKLVKAMGVNGVTLNRVNSEHNEAISDVSLMEVWISAKEDKSHTMGFDLPEGTLYASYYVASDTVWKAVKDGTFTGFSIEGLFNTDKKNFTPSGEKRFSALCTLEMKLLGKEFSFGKKAEETPVTENKEVATEVTLADAAPATDNNGPAPEDLKAIVEAINAIGQKVDALAAEVETLKNGAAQASDFRSEFSKHVETITKHGEAIEKLSAAPAGEVAGKPESKKAEVKLTGNSTLDAVRARIAEAKKK